jgi:hypothetical protein
MAFDDHDEPLTLFLRDGPERFVPTGWGRGPWDQAAMHGGAPGALLTQLADGHDSLVPMRIARLAFEILRPVPLAPLDVTTSVEREGKRLQLLQLILSSDAMEVMRVRALRLRRGDHPLPDGVPTAATPDELGLGTPDGVAVSEFPPIDGWGPFFADAMEMRNIAGGLMHPPGPGASWFRLRLPVIDDELPTPAARVAATADFGNGLAAPVPFREWIYINADLMVVLQREPIDEWVGMASLSVPAPDGTALTTSRLADRTGQLGIATQSLYIEPRPEPLG